MITETERILRRLDYLKYKSEHLSLFQIPLVNPVVSTLAAHCFLKNNDALLPAPEILI